MVSECLLIYSPQANAAAYVAAYYTSCGEVVPEDAAMRGCGDFVKVHQADYPPP